MENEENPLYFNKTELARNKELKAEHRVNV